MKDRDTVRKYFRRLKTHPGVPIASLMTVAGGIAGATDKGYGHPMVGFLSGVCASAIFFWSIVFLTNINRED